MPAEEIGLVLDGLAASAGLEDVEQLAVAGFLARRHVVMKGVQELVDDARDLALRNHQVAAAERPVPVGGVRPQNVQDTFGDAAIVTRPDHGAEDNPAPPSCARSRTRSWLARPGMSGYARAPGGRAWAAPSSRRRRGRPSRGSRRGSIRRRSQAS